MFEVRKVIVLLALLMAESVYAEGEVSLSNEYATADENGKIAICAPVTAKVSDLVELGLYTRHFKGESLGKAALNHLYQLSIRAELLSRKAESISPPAVSRAWEDSADDKTLRNSDTLYALTAKCFALIDGLMKQGRVEPQIKTLAANAADARITELVKKVSIPPPSSAQSPAD